MEITKIIAFVIGFFLLSSIGIFIFSIIRKWGKMYTVYWGLVVFLCSHLLLFFLVIFVEPTELPPVLNGYAIGILDLLEKLVTI